MTTYFTADPHFGHARIIDLCQRPFNDVDEMNMHILSKINETVGPEDRLVILGDVCMGKLDESLPLLGRIKAADVLLIPGNHDRFSLAYQHTGDADAKREAFRQRYEDEDQRHHTLAINDRKPSAWNGDELGFSYLAGHPLSEVIFSHYPYEGDSQGEDRAGFLRCPNGGSPIIHGHVHNEWRIKDRQFNVGVDVNDFTPVHEDVLIEWVRSL